MARDESVDTAEHEYPLPDIADDDDFSIVIKKLSIYFRSIIELPSTFEQLRTTAAGACLRDLVEHLGATCHNPAIVNALLALKWHYDTDTLDHILNEARSSACEIVAWRFLACLSDGEAVQFCLYEIPDPRIHRRRQRDGFSDEEEQQQQEQQEQQQPQQQLDPMEATPLLQRRAKRNSDGADLAGNFPRPPTATSSRRSQLLDSVSYATYNISDDATTTTPLSGDSDPTIAFRSLNALEIAVIAGAKRFLGRSVVQRIVTGIWHGDVIVWDALSVHATKTPRFYDPARTDPYSRLRVPKYLKSWEAVFFVVFLYLYYAVLIQRVAERITATEAVLWVWIAAFCYDEFSEWLDAGSVFYVTDIWNVCDVIMMLLGCVFAVLRIIGVMQHDNHLNGIAFDILALEALFLVPRICSLLSLSPSWGILIPCLKEMTIDFIKFMVIILVIYCGFLTTFSLLGRDHFTPLRMAGVLGKIFFGSSYVGFEIMSDIDPIFGPPLMILFITLSGFLLMGSLAGLMANSFARVMNEAHDEYLYVYSVYVLEASTSNRLTHFYPPFNLLALLVFRPWRLVFRGDDAFRGGRIWLLKVTHTPIVAVIRLYEVLTRRGPVLALPQLSGAMLNPIKGSRRPVEFEPGTPQRGRRRTKAQQQQRSRLHSQEATAVERDDDGRMGEGDDAASSLEAQIGVLNSKIDRLTDIVMEMQLNRELRNK